jgi:hypothetical protein
MVILISGVGGSRNLRRQNPLETKSAKAVRLSVQTARHDWSDKVWRIIMGSWALLVIPCLFEGGFTAYMLL